MNMTYEEGVSCSFFFYLIFTVTFFPEGVNFIALDIKFATSGKNVTLRIRYSKNIVNKMEYYNLLHYIISYR